ncbi:MAG: cysteine--tRNA ligase [Bacteroidales bacterium]|nr:cysteine--tRNA ligase [Bacteroidales bacterium]
MEPTDNNLFIYNTLSRSREKFQAINPPFAGMYVCGPTVYGDGHLGHARPAITFDLVFRYLKELGYKVRYVRNITDVGHLENDADEGEDKITKKARLDQLEPMEVVQFFTDSYHKNMDQLNVLRPSIEPRASGHIIEQIEIIEKIIEKGFAYECNGSVYFDVPRYNEEHSYGKLSGRKLEDMLTNTRSLGGQHEKKHAADFALWKKADDMHIMRWPSPWSEGYPGWHAECSAMGRKYLGTHFDIHGGGMDLVFPHHEAEIAQSVAANGHEPVKYWMHNNMITINGQKMGKSLGNFITLHQFFSGNHPELEMAYTPMTIRFFMLQAHYRSTLDFSNEALQAAAKGYKRLMEASKTLQTLKSGSTSTFDTNAIRQKCFDAMNDDFNSPMVIAHLFEAVKAINTIHDGKAEITEADLIHLKETFRIFISNILGLLDENTGGNAHIVNGLMDTILELRHDAKTRKDWTASDLIRDKLKELGIQVKDTRDGATWMMD